MGYARYILPDGRHAGYAVEAQCDHPQCTVTIDRGLGYLCGQDPDGHRDPSEPGCGKYHCSKHQSDHACPNPDGVCTTCDGEGEVCINFSINATGQPAIVICPDCQPDSTPR